MGKKKLSLYQLQYQNKAKQSLKADKTLSPPTQPSAQAHTPAFLPDCFQTFQCLCLSWFLVFHPTLPVPQSIAMLSSIYILFFLVCSLPMLFQDIVQNYFKGCVALPLNLMERL